MASILRSNRDLRRLMAAWLQSCLGTGAGYVALLFLTVRYLHSSWAVSAVLLADFLPAIAFGAAFGALADRYSRSALVAGANLVQAAAWCGLAFAHTAAPILILALVAGSGNALQRPAMRAALPVVAGPAKQAAAAWYDTCRWIGITVGPLLSAAFFTLAGVGLPLALNGLSFLIAAVAIATIAMDGGVPGETHVATEAHGRGVRDGLRVAFSAPSVAAVIGCSAATAISMGLLNVCEPLLATKVLHGSGSDYALLVACYGAGMITGSLLVARRGDVEAGVILRRYLASLLLSGLGMAGSAIVGSIEPATIAFAATGYANALLVVSETQLIQLRVPNAVQGRLFGVKDTLEGICFLIGLLGAGVLVAGASVRLTLATGSVLYGICLLAGVATLGVRERGADGLLAGLSALGAREPRAEVLVATDPLPATRRFDPDVYTASPIVRRRFDPDAQDGRPFVRRPFGSDPGWVSEEAGARAVRRRPLSAVPPGA